MSYQAIFFDLDGTLHDRNATIQHWLRRHLSKFDLPDAYATRFLELDDFGYRSKRDVFPQLIQEFELGYQPQTLLDDYSEALSLAKAMPDAHEVLRELREHGVKIGIVTNGWQEAQERCIKNCGLEQLVDDVVISKVVGLSKPDPQIYSLALEHLQVRAAQSWFVGDSPRNDIWGPQQIGMRAAYLPTGHALTAEKPDALLGNLRDVLKLADRPISRR